jgi:copper transport protein
MSAMRRALIALAGCVFGLGATLVAAAPASAHAVFTGSTPAAGVVLPAAPASVTLTFSEPVRAVPGRIRIVAPDGQRAEQEPTISGGVVTIPLRPGGGNGTYLVSYRVISADSHPVSGSFSYSVGAPSATGDLPAERAVDPAVGVLIPVAKYLGYAGLVLLVGPVLVLLALWPQRLSRRRPTLLAWLGVGLVGLSTVLALVLQAPYTTGTSLGGITGTDIGDVFGSPFGTAMLVRLAALGATALLLRPVLRGQGSVADRGLLAILAVVGLATFPISGHPSASPVPLVSVLADFAHVGSMAVWLGGLVMLIGFLLPQATESELEAILPIWARWAALAVVVLLVAGSLQALIEIGTPSALVDTTYGRLVLAKIGLFGLVLGVAWFSRKLVRDRVAPGRPGTIRRAVTVELGITAAILAVTTVLVQTTPGRTAEANSTVSGSVYASTLTTGLYKLQIQIDPATVGPNYVHLYAYTADDKPQNVLEWKATAALPSAGVEPIDVPLVRVLDYHSSGAVTLPSAGDWVFRFTLRTSEIDQASVTATVPIR